MHRLLILFYALSLTSPLAAGSWSQFGGPTRDFTLAEAPSIALWGDSGPRQLWQRELGPGYSGIVSDAAAERLFTMTREGEEEVVIALDAHSGDTLWQYRYQAPVSSLRGVDMSYGNAPQSTPLYHDGKLFTLGFTGLFHALDADSGKLLWSKDPSRELEAGMLYFGYAASPLLVTDADDPTWQAVVILAGGALAFDVRTGELLWQNRTFGASYASPIVADTRFGRQLIVAGAGEVVALEPLSGELLWRHEYANQHRTMLGTPLLIDDDLLFVSSYFLGSRGLKLVTRDRVETLWEQPDFQVSHFNAVRHGSTVFTTYRKSLLALEARSGEILWRERRFGAANLMQAGDLALLLGDMGQFTTARLDRQGVQPRHHAQLLDERSWTPPTLVGNKLYLRDQVRVMAVDLSQAGEKSTATAPATETRASPAFTAAIERLQAATLGGEVDAIAQAAATFATWDQDPLLRSWAAYYRGFGLWMLSQVAPAEDRLGYLDRAVEAQKRAVELDRTHADAHAVLGNLYSAYYRLAPRRAAVIGPLSDEHIDRALALEPDNPRALAIHGLELAYTPTRWGGDPAAARQLLAEIVDRSPLDRPLASGPRPAWEAPMSRFWLARLLLIQAPKDPARARALLDQTLNVHPDFALARALRQSLDESKPDSAGEAQERGSSKASSRPR